MTGKVALVTGSSAGIGLSIALSLARAGFTVFGTARRPERVAAPAGVTIIPLDVRSGESVAACVAQVLQTTGRIDLLVNNAGATMEGAIEETSIEEAKALFEVNFFGVMRMTQAVLPIMRQQGAGRVITIGSVAGFLPMPYEGVYAATKHALEGWSETLDHEVRRLGIRVVLVEPTFIRTEIVENRLRAAVTLEPYAGGRQRTMEVMQKSIAGGDHPDAVAAIVLRAARTSSPKPRYLAGRGARFQRLLRFCLPTGLFDFGLRSRFRLDAAS